MVIWLRYIRCGGSDVRISREYYQSLPLLASCLFSGEIDPIERAQDRPTHTTGEGRNSIEIDDDMEKPAVPVWTQMSSCAQDRTVAEVLAEIRYMVF
jgi:hypothetical protein